MKTEQIFQEGLKTLLKTKPLDEINVIMLCDFVHSNRQTFYYHFRDIADVVDSTFLGAKVGYGKKLLDYDQILKEMINYISANYQYVSSINKSYASDRLYSFFFSYFYLKVGNLLKITGFLVRKLPDTYQFYPLKNSTFGFQIREKRRMYF